MWPHVTCRLDMVVHVGDLSNQEVEAHQQEKQGFKERRRQSDWPRRALASLPEETSWFLFSVRQLTTVCDSNPGDPMSVVP